MDDRQKKYTDSDRGKSALKKARDKYDSKDPESRKKQKRDYMRRKRASDPNYCKWK